MRTTVRAPLSSSPREERVGRGLRRGSDSVVSSFGDAPAMGGSSFDVVGVSIPTSSVCSLASRSVGAPETVAPPSERVLESKTTAPPGLNIFLRACSSM